MVNNSVVSEPAFFCRFALIMANSVPIRFLYPKNRNMHDNLSKIYDNLSKQAVFEVFFCVSEVVFAFPLIRKIGIFVLSRMVLSEDDVSK